MASKKKVARPTFGKGADGYEGHESRALTEDRATRAAWDVVLRSPYLRQTAIPDEVAPGDCDTARAIVLRLDGVLEQDCWTPAERARLRGQRKAWMRRAGRQDVEFNLIGWRKKRTYTGRGEWEHEQEAKKVAGIIEGIRQIWRDKDGTGKS